MARIEWYASLYLNKGRVCIPSLVLEAAFVKAAQKRKLGKQAQAGIFIDEDMILNFDGDNLTIDELWERDTNRHCVAVRVQTNKIMRTRSIFHEWSGAFEIHFDDEALNASQVEDIVNIAGSQIGLCDWRPKFGRFQVVS